MDQSEEHLPHAPPKELYSGELGEELIVLSNPEIRIAERAVRVDTCLTADGPVQVRPGDFIVSMPDGERYPVKPDVFFGTYEILSQVGSWYVGRRLLHPRRAWPIESTGAEFDYGPDRGRVAAARGGWVYQSVDDDFGLINAEALVKSYVVVGPASLLQQTDWARRFRRMSLLLTTLPVALTGLALVALQVSVLHPTLAKVLLALEAVLLAVAAVSVWTIRRDRWSLRAAATAGLDVARRFQLVVRALGLPASSVFPTMTLWRAAQDDRQDGARVAARFIASINQLIDDTQEQARQDFRQYELLEHRVDSLTWMAAAAVLACLGLVALWHSQPAKLAAVWLPSVVGAAHAWTWKRQAARRAGAAAEIVRELRFVRSKLVSLAPQGVLDESDNQRCAEVTATLRMLCRCIAQHTERELQLTAGEKVSLPV